METVLSIGLSNALAATLLALLAAVVGCFCRRPAVMHGLWLLVLLKLLVPSPLFVRPPWPAGVMVDPSAAPVPPADAMAVLESAPVADEDLALPAVPAEPSADAAATEAFDPV